MSKSPLLSSSSTTSFPSTLPSTPPPLPASLVPQVDSLERRLQDLQDYQLPQLQDSANLQSTTRESHEELVKGVRNELAGVRRDLDVRTPTLKVMEDGADREWSAGIEIGCRRFS